MAMAGYFSLAVTLVLFFSLTTAYKFPFMNESSFIDPHKKYDYIIVGGGTAGCALAATLSDKFKVLVLERGGSPYENPLVMREENFFLAFLDPASQSFISTDGVVNARGRVLGGGSTINAGFYDRAPPSEIEQLGLDPARVNESYTWVENMVVSKPTLGPFQTAFHEGLVEIGVTPDNGVTYEHPQGTKTGGSLFDDQGTRRPSSDLLAYANPNNIQVLLHATVRKIIFQNPAEYGFVMGRPVLPRAVGVEFTDTLGTRFTVGLTDKPESEVIVSAGAVGTPQLLMLSGVGPRKDLEEMGVKVVVDLPGVGKDIADNPSVRLYVPSPSPVEVSLVKVAGITSFGSYIESLSGPQNLQGSVIFQKAYGPRSTGQVRLATTDVSDNPLVTFNYYQDPVDLEICIGGLNKVEELLMSKSMMPFVFGIQALPSGGVVSVAARKSVLLPSALLNETLGYYCKANIVTMWHYHGSCRVGQAVDPEYRLLGVEGVRLVDGSVFDFCPGTNPQATFMMFGRYMGLKITEERKPFM